MSVTESFDSSAENGRHMFENRFSFVYHYL